MYQIHHRKSIVVVDVIWEFRKNKIEFQQKQPEVVFIPLNISKKKKKKKKINQKHMVASA